MIKAVLFDFDDTLVNSESARLVALRNVALRIANMYKLNCDDVITALVKIEQDYDRRGIFDRNLWWAKAFETLKIIPEENIINELTSIYWDVWIKNTHLYQDTLPTISLLKSCNLKVGIIANNDGKSGNKRRRIELSGIPSNMLDLIIVAGDDVNQIKPHPEPFIKAIDELKIKPWEAIYVGDKPYADVPGAKEIGMFTAIVIRNNIGTYNIFNGMSYNEKPDLIIGNLMQLPFILKCDTIQY